MQSLTKASCPLALTNTVKPSTSLRTDAAAACFQKVQKKAFLVGSSPHLLRTSTFSRRATRVCAAARLGVYAAFQDQDPEKLKAEYESAMQDPEAAKQIESMQAAMSNPEMKQQMDAMGAFMQNDEVKSSIREMEDDPEMAEFFDSIKKNPQNLMKFMNDPKMLEKFAKKLGPVAAQVAPGAGYASPPAAEAEPEINDLLDASKFGDLDAVEDFIAIGKDVNLQDELGRSPLHFACAHDHMDIVKELIANKANVNIVDAKNNTPLHYSSGYGRIACIKELLASGADVALLNETGKTAAVLASMDERNPVAQDADLMAKLNA